MSDETRQGGCNCGSVRYEIAPTEEKPVVCHCNSCQRQSASAFGMVIVVPSEKVTLLQGALKKWVRIAESGNKVPSYFCSTCGSRIWHGDKDSDPMLKVRAGTLDAPINFSTATHLWTSKKVPGIEIPASATSFECQPG